MSAPKSDIDFDFYLDDVPHPIGVIKKESEVTLRQDHSGGIGEYWNIVSVRDGELERLHEALATDAPLPDKIRGGSWKTDASVRDKNGYIALVQSSAGAGGRNGDSVRLNCETVNAILNVL